MTKEELDYIYNHIDTTEVEYPRMALLVRKLVVAYRQANKSEAILIALQNAGVDNWEGYSIAMEEVQDD